MKNLFALFAVVSVLSAFAEMEPATPESQGVDPRGILAFVDACEKTFDGGAAGAVHGFVIVRHGKVVAEGSWKPFDTLNETHMLYSHSKSFTATAIGFLVDDGRLDLDERVADIFPEDVPEDAADGIREIRVRDLLTMNVGSDLNHDVANYPNWRKRFFERKLDRKPGTGFKYDSDATYVLAGVVEKRTGMKLMDFLRERLFTKIGIEKAWTTTSPQGVACGGWGMNMTTRELARLGQLYLQKGYWNGANVISPYWVALATSRHTWSGWQNVGAQRLGAGTDWEQGYGFQFWLCTHNAFRADGAAGQYTVVMPEQDAVVSINAGLGDMQKELNLVWDHLLPAMKDAPLPEDAAADAALKDRLSNLEIAPVRRVCGFPVDWQKKFEFKDNPRGFKSVAFEPAENGRDVRCRLVTRAGEQTFVAGCGKWVKGAKIRIDTEDYEGLGAYVGEHQVAASCGVEDGPVFRLKAYLTGDTGHLEFKLKDGKLTGEFWAMGGCELESR